MSLTVEFAGSSQSDGLSTECYTRHRVAGSAEKYTIFIHDERVVLVSKLMPCEESQILVWIPDDICMADLRH